MNEVYQFASGDEKKAKESAAFKFQKLVGHSQNRTTRHIFTPNNNLSFLCFL